MKISDFLTITKDTLCAYNKLCEPVLIKYDIPQVSFDILMFLTNNPEFCTAQEISELRNIKKNLVSIHVEKLVKAGLLQRGTVSDDRRKIALSCTEKANPIIEEGLAVQKAFFDKITDGISQDDWSVFIKVNEKMTKNRKELMQE